MKEERIQIRFSVDRETIELIDRVKLKFCKEGFLCSMSDALNSLLNGIVNIDNIQYKYANTKQSSGDYIKDREIEEKEKLKGIDEKAKD